MLLVCIWYIQQAYLRDYVSNFLNCTDAKFALQMDGDFRAYQSINDCLHGSLGFWEVRKRYISIR